MKVDVISCMLDVLQSNKAVALPGLGQWQVNHVQSEIKGNRIYPPYKSINFNEKVGSPSSLAECIRTKYNISKKGADQVIQRFSKLLINRLVNYREVYIPRFGTLKSSGQKALNFQEDQPNAINLAKDYLPSFGLIAIEKETLVKAAVSAPNVVSNKVSKITPVEKTTPLPPSHYQDEKGCFATFFWPLLWLLLLAAICFFCLKNCASYRSSGNTDKSALVNGENGSTVNANVDLGDYDANREYLLSEINEIPDAVFEQGCVIIVGSYRKSRNVLNMKSKLRAQGKNVYTEVIPNGLTRVGFNLDCNRESVGDLIKTARKDLNNRSWYLKPKIKVNY